MNPSIIDDFRKQNEDNFSLTSVLPETKENVFTMCINLMEDPDCRHIGDAVVCLLILSRDPDYQRRFADDKVLKILLRDSSVQLDAPERSDEIKISALKCLSNVIFKNPSVVGHIRLKRGLDTIVDRIEDQLKGEPNLQILLYFLKILFLCSALESTSRLQILTSHFDSDIFVNILRLVLVVEPSLHPEVFDVAIEMLKLLYNLSYAKSERNYDQRLYESKYVEIASVIRKIIVKPIVPKQRRMELISHSVNFLTLIPNSCYVNLLFTPTDPEDSLLKCDLHADRHVTQALSVLVDFLTNQLDENDKSPARSAELLLPILKVMSIGSKLVRTIRKYFKMRILPPLGAEIKRLPESGNTLRNRLCSRLTASTKMDDGTVEAVAELIFILCKEKVDRAIKYSGFGNFVGFLSRHGLLSTSGCRDGDNYSSASSDSETEDYRKLRDQVNPVTGRVEPPRTNPLEGLSEEQKEFEVMRLVNKIDQLQRGGLIQPGVVGEDGRVRPAEHVLELLENAPEITAKYGEDSDSD